MCYIEQQREHFVLFMEDDEDFDDYISRMKTTREWGGHQELYAASQTFRVNIVVHQADYLNAPRFVLQCEEATRDIHLRYLSCRLAFWLIYHWNTSLCLKRLLCHPFTLLLMSNYLWTILTSLYSVDIQ